MKCSFTAVTVDTDDPSDFINVTASPCGTPSVDAENTVTSIVLLVKLGISVKVPLSVLYNHKVLTLFAAETKLLLRIKFDLWSFLQESHLASMTGFLKKNSVDLAKNFLV